MHIAYLTTEYPHATLPPAGGIGSFVKSMADSLVKQGHQVTIFLIGDFAKDREWIDYQIKIIEIVRVKTSRLSFLIDRLKIARVIKKKITELSIDLLECPDWEGWHAFVNLKIPIITRLHGSVTYFNKLENKRPSKLLYYLEKKALKRSNAIIAVSKFAGELTEELFLTGKPIHVIYNGVDTNKFKLTDELAQSDKTPSILYFGSLMRKKGCLEIPSIFNEVIAKKPEARLILAGKDTIDHITGESVWELMQKGFSSAALAKVDYRGTVPYHEMQQIIQQAFVCIFPSHAETFGLSTIESMIMKKPVITFDMPWNREIVEHGISGFLIHPFSHTLFAKKIFLLLDADTRVEMGKRAQIRAKDLFDQDKLIIENIKYYKKIVKAL